MKRELTVAQALKLFNTNKIAEGRSVLDKLLLENPANLPAHQLMVRHGMTSKDLLLAEKHLKVLVNIEPTNEHFLNPLIEIYVHQHKWFEVANLYKALEDMQSENSTVLFNCGYYLKLAGKFVEAIQYYNKVLKVGIEDEFEVYLNIATIYSEHLSYPDKALYILQEGIRKHPDKDALYYNLANLYEQLGDRNKALSAFQVAFNKNPKNYNALARQADIYRIKNKSDSLIKEMSRALQSRECAPENKINIAYALGKSYDDCGEYSLAFDLYQQANRLDQKLLPQYNQKKHEEYISNIINTFSKSWFETIKKSDNPPIAEPPIFICGMFRSGSTLCEQILAGHSNISIGGEQEYFNRTIKYHTPNFPNDIVEYLADNKQSLLAEYLQEINRFRKIGSQLTDKRPDNFVYLGLIKALMPEAKIIWTQRLMLDNCLSVFFLRLGPSMSYATKLENIIHFYKQQQKLMKHWQSLFSKDIYEFNYDELVSKPEKNIRSLLSFIDLPWENKCLKFHEVENQVKTASVWQVRQPLYNKSSGRWENYQDSLKKQGLL